MRLGAAIVLTGALAMPAQAQLPSALELGLALCRAVKDGGKRLQCFDTIADPKNRQQGSAAARTGTDPLAGPTVAEHTAWELKDSKSPLDDSPQLDAMLLAADGAGGLVLRCRDKKTQVIVAPKGYIGMSLSGGGMRVQYRIGTQPVREANWLPSTNGRAVFVPSPIPFIRSLTDNSAFFVRVFDFQGVGQDASFNLRDVSAVRTRLAQVCAWPQK